MASHTVAMPEELVERLRTVMAATPPPATRDPDAHGRRDAAVLLLADPQRPGLPLLFMLRSDRVSHHRNQIGFPGGSSEPGEDAVQAALRETQEEMGVDPADVEVLGQLTPLSTAVSNRWLTPVVGLARRALSIHPDPFEVQEWFRVPLETLLHCPHRTQVLVHDGVEHTVHFYDVEERVIWGVTGAVVHELLTKLGRED